LFWVSRTRANPRMQRSNESASCANSGASCSYSNRLALGGHKQEIRDLARQGQHVVKLEGLLKDPYVLQFLGIDRNIAGALKSGKEVQ
jgi:predicted nuclease of restriction endonuclease-like (RecB) superfamily